MEHVSYSRPASPLCCAQQALTLPDMALDFEFESSDILGGALPVGRGRVAHHTGFLSLFKVCALGVGILFFLLAFRHGRTFLLRWKERHYKLYAYFASAVMNFTHIRINQIHASTIRHSRPRPATIQRGLCCRQTCSGG